MPNIQLPLLRFLIRYRRTALGPMWLLVGPSLFIAMLGHLYAHIGSAKTEVFIPHLTVSLILWTLIQGFVTGSTTVFQRGRAEIMQGGQKLDDVIAVDVVTTVLTFAHQLPIVIVVFVIYRVELTWAALEGLIGLALIVANGVWTTKVFGILGARFRDLSEVFRAIMRIAFLATPIIWMPGDGDRGSVMEAFLVFNPLHHFIEVVRAPLLGKAVAPLSWIVVVSITLIGFASARVLTRRYARFVPLWI